MEITLYDKDWFTDDISAGFIINNQPREKLNLDRNSDSNAGHFMTCIPADKYIGSNCNDIMKLDGMDITKNEIFKQNETFGLIDDLFIEVSKRVEAFQLFISTLIVFDKLLESICFTIDLKGFKNSGAIK